MAPPAGEPVQPVEPASGDAPASGPQDELSAALEQPAAVVVATAPELQPVPPVPPVPPAGNAPVPGGAKKKGRVWLLAGIAALAVIVLIVAVVKLMPSGGGKDVLVYLNDDDELMFRKDLKAKTEPVELTDDETSSVLFSKDGKYIYYLESDAYSETGTLYRAETAKIGKKGFSPEKVSSDVAGSYDLSSYVRVLDNGGAVYIRGSGNNGQLRYYDGKESYKLANVSGYFSLDEKGAYAYYTEYDSADGTYSLYRVEVKDGGEKERLLKDADQIFGSYDANVLVYGKSNGNDGSGVWTSDIYSQTPGGDKSKLLSDVYSVVDVTVSGSKVSITYTTAQVEEHTLYDFVRDSMASSDANEREPSTSNYQTYGYWGWTTDWDAYSAAYDKWLEVETRNEIRQELRDTDYNLTTYTLHRYEDGKDTVLAEGLAFAYPRCSVSDGIYIYAKSEQDVSVVCDVSDLEYWSEIYNKIDTSERIWYQNVKGTESELGLDEDADTGVSSLYVLNGKEAVLSIYEDGESLIQAYSIGKDKLTFSSIVTDEDCISLQVGKNGKQDVLYYMTDLSSDHSSGDLMYYVNGNKATVAREAAEVVLLDDGKAVFKADEITYNNRRNTTECSLYAVKDGKNERIADDVAWYSITYLDTNRVLYISDGDLFVWNGSASEKLASDVTSFWSSRYADSQVFSADW